MKKITLLSTIGLLLIPFIGLAQNDVPADASGNMNLTSVQCKNYSACSWRDNWFLQLGVGIQSPFVENDNGTGKGTVSRKVTMAYALGVGHWFSPYLAFRLHALGGKMKWTSPVNQNTGNHISGNVDLMWDMINSIKGPNPDRFFRILPFIGVGCSHTWHLRGESLNIYNENGLKRSFWSPEADAGAQFSFRLSKYIDFFLEGRIQVLPDNFNGCEYGNPLDINVTAFGGFNINFGGKKYQTANPCDYMSYINQLNDQANNLRSQLNNANAALAAAEAQLPCKEVKTYNCPEEVSPMLGAVRFTINSAKISKSEMVSVYNIAQWMKANPDAKVIISGYADKDTGTSAYNQKLSERRANNVYDQMVKYGVNKDNLTINSYGSSEQPYANENNWNRIVLFSTK